MCSKISDLLFAYHSSAGISSLCWKHRHFVDKALAEIKFVASEGWPNCIRTGTVAFDANMHDATC